MRVCLVNPPSAFLIDQRVFPPLGLLRVGAVLEAAGHAVVLADCETPPTGCAVYACTATTAQMPALLGMLPLPGRTVLGGAHATMLNAAAKRGSARAQALRADLEARFDCVVYGDGEHAVLTALSDHRALDADDPHSPLWVSDQDATPLPARHLLDLQRYHYEIDGARATSLVTQLGCPFGCGFCGGRHSPTYRRVRNRSVDSVMREVDALVTLGYRGLMLLDDELNVSKGMLELMRRLAPYRLALRGFVKASLFTEAQADAMAEAGFREVLFGFESGDDGVLRAMQKGSVADNTRAFRMARRAGLRVKALMSIGHPGESRETLRATHCWLQAVRPDALDITVITPYPGTPYWDDAVSSPEGWTYTARTGARLHLVDADWGREAHYYKGAPGAYRSYVFTDALSPTDLVEARDTMETDLRALLGLSWPAPSYEHSMGQTA